MACLHGDIRELDLPKGAYDVISIAHVIHDIPPSERQVTVDALATPLKESGTLHINEPTNPSHGMPVEKIRTLMSQAGLREVDSAIDKSTYVGGFRPAASITGS